MDASRKLAPAQLKALLRADVPRATRSPGVIEAGTVDTRDADSRNLMAADSDRTSTSVIVSRAYLELVEKSNLRIQSLGDCKTAPIRKVRRAANS